MMNNREDQQLDRVARYLDGELLELSSEERALAQEIEGHEAMLSRAMGGDIGPSAMAMNRARRRMTAALAAPVTHKFGVLRIGSLVAAAAAAVLVISVLLPPPATQTVREGSGLDLLPPAVRQSPTELMNVMSVMSLDNDQLDQPDNGTADLAFVLDLESES